MPWYLYIYILVHSEFTTEFVDEVEKVQHSDLCLENSWNEILVSCCHFEALAVGFVGGVHLVFRFRVLGSVHTSDSWT